MEAFKQSLREVGRLIIMAVVAYALTNGVIDVFVSNLAGAHLSPEAKIQASALITVVLRAIDKFLYEHGVDTNNEKMKNGLTFGL